MRKKEEILADYNSKSQTTTSAGAQAAAQEAMLEVFIDIRDVLVAIAKHESAIPREGD